MRFHIAHARPSLSEHQSAQKAGRLQHRLKKAVGVVVTVACIASSLVVANAITAGPAEAAEPLSCTPGAVYVQSSSQVREFTVDAQGGTLGTTTIGTGHSDNGLGISAGGRYAYTVTNSSTNKTLAKHDRVTDQTTTTPFTLSSAVLRGAVNPKTGVYYFASSTSSNRINLYAWDENVTPQTYVQVGTLRPTDGSSAFGANGDMAFSASGQLVLVADNYIYSADIPSTLASSTATIGAKQVHDMGAGTQGNGIAFGSLGHIFVSVSGSNSRIIEVDLARGVTLNTTSLGSFSPTDMASCTFPNTLTLKKEVPGGRDAASDQFGLRIDSPSTYQVTQTNATTTGNATGLQADYAGPIFTNQGDRFTLSESAAGSTNLNQYDSTLRCEQPNADGSTTPVAVSASNQVTQPAGPLGTDVTCTFVNTLLTPGLELRKNADPASGTPVSAGQTITYTIEAENTGNTTLNPVEIADNLSAVLQHAEYQNDVVTTIDGTEISSGAAAVTGTDLAWTGVLEPGQIVSITYSVKINDGVEGEKITNRVTASGTPPGPLDPIIPPTVTTDHPVAGFALAKTSAPAAGTVVEPGQNIEYTVTGTNTGDTALTSVTIADNLADVLTHATYNNDIATAINGTPATVGAAVISGNDLTWGGTLQPGESVTITYSVTVDEEASGEILRNVVTGSATPTMPNPADPTGPQIPGEPITPPVERTEHPVVGSGFTLSKSADPVSGAAVQAGDTIEYTITGTNTGDTVLDPANIVDDLSGVLSHATYNDDVSSSRGVVNINGDSLTWTGSIPRGESITITYTVTVNDGVQSALLQNTAIGEATPQIPDDPTDPDSPTTPGAKITPPPAETIHPVVDTGFEIRKSANPASGTAVRGGDTIEYTVTGTNTGNTILDPASIDDDLSSVLANAVYNGDITATTGNVATTGNTLSWTGALAPGDDVVITYTVTVNDDATGVMLRNTVAGVATPLIPADPTQPNSPTTPGEPVSPPPSTTEHPVINPGFEITKTADPATGTRVDPGSVVEYTVTATNTGDTVLDPVEITDNLASVLVNAQFNDDIAASRGAANITGDTLTWTGVLTPGQNVVISYSVTVNADAGGDSIDNSVTGSAIPLMPEDPADPNSPTTPGMPVVPPTVTTEHPVNEPGFTFVKSVDPISGTAVDPGQVLTYTLTGTNTGETALNSVSIIDDLSGVLEFSSYNGDGVATVNAVPATAPAVVGTELSWSGPLAVGQTVTVTYSVTVGPEAAGEVLENSAWATATPPGGKELTPPPSTTVTPVNLPGFSVSKSANPATGAAVDPGSIISYSVTGTNTGETALYPVELTDDLSGVLAHAEYNDDALATINGGAASTPTVAGDTLLWSGALRVGETVTITYSVTVNGAAGGELLKNIATGSATPPGGVPPIHTPPTVTENPVNNPGFEVVKSADPASGTRVDPGSIITYTVEGINTGQTALGSVTITDDLSDVLNHAVYRGDAEAMVGTELRSAPSVATDQLSWAGALAIGERVTITYSVKVNGDAGGELVANVATGTALPPGGTQLTPPPSSTVHPVGAPGFEFAKTSDPRSGTAVATGSVVTYTLTGVNTGETDLDEVVITDDLSKVLPHADFNKDVVAKVADQVVTSPVMEGSELTWTGRLAEGETVTITYSVTVHNSAAGQTLNNVAGATATPPGNETITPPPSVTENPVLSPLAYTGGLLMPWALGLSLLLMLGGGMLVLLRRRTQS